MSKKTAIAKCSGGLPLVVVDPGGVPFLFGFGVFGGDADGDDGQGGDVGREAEIVADAFDDAFVGIAGKPDGAQVEGGGGEQEIFGSGRAVFEPIVVGNFDGLGIRLGTVRAAHAGCLSAYDDDGSGVGHHFPVVFALVEAGSVPVTEAEKAAINRLEGRDLMIP